MQAGIVGAGRMGQALEKWLIQHGFRVTWVARHRNDPWNWDHDNDVVFLAVWDQALEAVAHTAQKAAQTATNSPVLVHLSGAMSAEVLDTYAGFKVALHPAVSVSNFEVDNASYGSECLSNAVWTIQGDTASLDTFCAQTQISPVVISAADKAQYHAACCLVSSHIYGVAASAQQLLAEIGFTSEKASQVVSALLSSTACTVAATPHRNLAKAATGPRARNDLSTINAHLEALASQAQALQLYRCLDQHLTNMLFGR